MIILKYRIQVRFAYGFGVILIHCVINCDELKCVWCFIFKLLIFNKRWIEFDLPNRNVLFDFCFVNAIN